MRTYSEELVHEWPVGEAEPSEVTWLRECFREARVIPLTNEHVDGLRVRVAGTVEHANSLTRKFTATVQGPAS